ncbi:MAG: hypothetical protein Kow0042_18810 [Calditrichia bacterium]
MPDKDKNKELEFEFTELKNLNRVLSRQVQEYFLLFDGIRKLSSSEGLKSFYANLDDLLKKNFYVDEYALILQNPNSDILSVYHSMGLPKRPLHEIFYRPNESIVGKVFVTKEEIYVPDISALKGFYYFYMTKKVQGSLYYLPILDAEGNALGVLKMRKVIKDGFSELERTILAVLQAEIGKALVNAQRIEKLIAKCYFDPLTKLHNRSFFNEHFRREFKRAQRYHHALSLMLIRIENFESNNSSGRMFGSNEILKEVANILRSNTRSSDLCIRYDSKEFIILFPETKKIELEKVSEKLGEVIRNFLKSQPDLDLKFSLGVASYPDDTIEPNLMLEIANKGRMILD